MSDSAGGRVRVRYWASAKAAAGLAEEYAEGPISLADLTDQVLARHDDALARVVPVCSVLVDGHPMKTRDQTTVIVQPGSDVEFLPPFAGG